MRILIVDDQLSVINGLMAGVDFVSLGIDQVESASGVQEAKEIIQSHTVDILLCDIEMPGENGLKLNKWILEHDPEMLRILLTSHTDFAYAQEGIKLQCFDYIVQPAPYQDIEIVLRRAVRQIQSKQQADSIYRLGKVYKNNELDLVESSVIDLYSKHTDNITHGLLLLNELGYAIHTSSRIQLLVLEPYPYNDSSPPAATHTLKKVLMDVLKKAGISDESHAFVTLNRFAQFSILLFGPSGTESFATDKQFFVFYDMLTQTIGTPMPFYVGNCVDFPEIRSELHRLHSFIDNNTMKKPQLYLHCSPMYPAQTGIILTESLPHWRQLLQSGQKDLLRSEIMMWIDHIAASGNANFRNLCSLHQQLTQFFFQYLTDIDSHLNIIDLFTEEYSYNNYIDGVKSVEALKEAVARIMQALNTVQNDNASQSDVERAQTYILANLSRNITVKDVADHVYLSPEYFTKLFKKHTGKNIKDYILQTKLEIAKELLRTSNLSISMIGLELGYSNFSHFCQMFKKFENMTPSEYRKAEGIRADTEASGTQS